jgi:hypothetical protein
MNARKIPWNNPKDFSCVYENYNWNVAKKLIGTHRAKTGTLMKKNIQTRLKNVAAARNQLTLCSIRSLSATIAMNSLLVGFDLLMLIV